MVSRTRNLRSGNLEVDQHRSASELGNGSDPIRVYSLMCYWSIAFKVMKNCYVAGCSTHINQPPGKMPLAALSDSQAVVSECLLLLLTNEPLTLAALFFELLHSPWVLHVVGTCRRPRLHCIAPRTFTPKALPVDLVGPCIQVSLLSFLRPNILSYMLPL